MCPPGRTLFDGISHLRPGRLVEFGADGDRERRYWRPRYTGTMSGTRAELADGLRQQIERSVGRRLANRSPGVVLSGGLDSSIVAAAAARVRPPESDLRTYSMIFPGAPYDESWKVRSVTSALGIEPAAFELAPQGALWLCLRSIERWKLPLMAVGGLVDTASVDEAAREGVEVVLDGQTGDETLGFSPYLLSDRLMRGRLLAALELTRRWPLGRATTRQEKVQLLKLLGVKGAAPHGIGRLIRKLRQREGDGPVWLLPAARREFLELEDPWAWKLDAPGPRWWQYLSYRLVDAPHTELRFDYLRQRAAAAGVSDESPLYDFDLVDYCQRLPPELAFNSAFSRPLAREAMQGMIPDDVRLNDQKANFSAFCFDTLTGADAPGIGGLLTAPDAELGAYADMEWVRNRWENRPEPGANTGSWGTAVWRLAAAECWLRSQSDPTFVETMLDRNDIRPISTRRVSLTNSGIASGVAEV